MKPTLEQAKAYFNLVKSFAEIIRAAGSIPSGHLYVQVMNKMSLDQYALIIETLKSAGLVREAQSHLLTWVEPTLTPTPEMKAPKVPKSHAQLGLPVGTRIRYHKGKMKSQIVGTIVEGDPSKLTVKDGYWVRPANFFRAVQVKAQQIDFIELHPGAPPCPPPRKAPTPCPSCPPPQPRSTPYSLLADELMHPIPVFCGACGNAHPTTQCPGPLPFAHQGITPGHLQSNIRSLQNIPLPTRLADLPGQPDIFKAQILAGKLDASLDNLRELIHNRTLIVRATQVQQMKAALKKGDRIRICGRIRPRRLVGCEGVVLTVKGSKFVSVDLGSQGRMGIPANCLEKI